jgi:hypothetical protein
VPVTDDQIATLRALLKGEREEHRQLLNQLNRAEANVGYSALLAAGFFEAVERRFMANDQVTNHTRVIDFVASVRERTDETPDAVNPDVAERMIFHALDQGASISDLDSDTVIQHQIILLAALIGDAQMDELKLDAFLRKIRADADELIE